MAFDKRLLERKMEEAGVSQVRLAGLVGVTARTVNRWLREDKPPKAAHIQELARLLRCKPEDFDPRLADGENEIHVEARVSAASHNAFAAMDLVYGVDMQTIIELAPVLFSIVAARAVNLPGEEAARWDQILNEAESMGRSLWEVSEIQYGNESRLLDEEAARNNRCFGQEAGDDWMATPRNLFVEAMKVMVKEAGHQVNMDQAEDLPPGEAPTARGFIPHAGLFDYIAEGETEIARRLTQGEVRLAQSVIKADLSPHQSFEEKSEIIRKDLLEQTASHRAKLLAQREKSLEKLKAWRAHYQERHPDLAQEYDSLVATYCHDEGWYPDYYNQADREADYANPFRETRFINDDLLPRPREVSGRRTLWFSFNAPEARRLRELEKDRRQSRAKFVESGQ